MTTRTFAQHETSKTNLRPRIDVDHDLKAAYAHRKQPITRPNQPAEPSRLVPTTPADWESCWLSRYFRTSIEAAPIIAWHVNLFATMQGKPGNFGTQPVTVHKPTGSKEVDPDADEDDIPFGKWEWARNPPPYNDERDDEPHRVRPEQQ